jgi:alanine dehydrogenase
VSDVADAVRLADVVIGAVLVTGARAPHVVSADMVRSMQPGSVIVDISVDQGGCVETTRPTTYEAPTYQWEGVTHFCVTNMPGAVPRTSTYALNNATLPFVLALADKGWQKALEEEGHLRSGLNVARGRVTHPGVATALELPYLPPEAALR